MKSVQIRSFSGPYFPVFGMNTEKYEPEKTPYLGFSESISVFSPNTEIYGPDKTPSLDTFHAAEIVVISKGRDMDYSTFLQETEKRTAYFKRTMLYLKKLRN